MSPLKNYQSRMISLLTRQELLVAEIYRFFSGLYPATREFWDGMAKEEMEHAGWMEYFSHKAQSAEMHFLEGHLKTYTVESFVNYLEESLAKAKEKAPPPHAAFSLALNIENSLLVKKIFERFASSDRELNMLLLQLQGKMDDHRARMMHMAASLGPA